MIRSTVSPSVAFTGRCGRRDMSCNASTPPVSNRWIHLCPVFRLTPYSRHSADLLAPRAFALSTNSSLKVTIRCSFQGIPGVAPVTHVLSSFCYLCIVLGPVLGGKERCSDQGGEPPGGSNPVENAIRSCAMKVVK